MGNPFIRKMEYGTNLTDEDRQLLSSITLRSQPFRARRDIIHEGDPPHDAHIVMDGFACRYKQLRDGRRQIMAVLVPGDLCDFHVRILGEMDHSIGTITAASIVAVSPEIIDQMTSNPRINRGLWWMTLVDEGTLREWLLNVGQRSSEARLAHILCELRLRLLSVGVGEHDRFEMPLTQTDLADSMGLTPVHVNRTMQRLRAVELIRTNNRHVIVPDPGRLERFADFDPNYLHLRDAKVRRSEGMQESSPQ